MAKSFTYHWQWHLKSSPEQFWPFISDTNRFNLETAVPSVSKVSTPEKPTGYTQRLRLYRFGIPVTWDEEPFEWEYLKGFSVTRNYVSGPVKAMIVTVRLTPEETGTLLSYSVEAWPANALGYIAIPLQIGIISAQQFSKVVLRFDALAQNAAGIPYQFSSYRSPLSDNRKLETLSDELVKVYPEPAIVNALRTHIQQADDMQLQKMRPYELAGKWRYERKQVLSVFLHATRLGMLELHWDILCPLCRGTQQSTGTLQEISTPVHCESCNISFDVNFDRLVEIVFRPHPSIKRIQAETFCIGGPQITPHIIVQKKISPGSSPAIPVTVTEGAYRIRTRHHSNGLLLYAVSGGDAQCSVKIDKTGITGPESCGMQTTIQIQTAESGEDIFILERMKIADDAVTAAEISTLQIFRDLFSSEALRPGEHISVGKAVLLFTDLKNSTRMYREIGDAKAFSYVMDHFDVLKNAISSNNGAVVKTIGDAVMGVFLNPLDAIQALYMAQKELQTLASPHEAVLLKAGIHYGACIAVNLNNNFDYFGSTVNIAARLEGLSSGTDIIISDAVYRDAQVKDWLECQNDLTIAGFEAKLKGFEGEQFDVYRVNFNSNKNSILP